MSIFGQSENPTILMVADPAEPSFRDAVATLSQARAGVAVVSDVYSAMARLALATGIRHVLVDVRNLDPHERAFLQLAPRYFRDVQISIADLPGAAARMRLEDSAAPMKTIAAFVTSALAPSDNQDHQIKKQPLPDRLADPAAELPRTPPSTQPAPHRPLSTDGGPLADDATPSLHEAVRRRMAGDESGGIQRTPPARTPPKAAPTALVPPPSEQSRPTVTPQEIDALLAPNDVLNPESPSGDGNTGRHR